MTRFLRLVAAVCTRESTASAFLVMLACVLTPISTAAGQSHNDVEVVSADVWLGSSLFTIEDLENLDAACSLTPEQREAATELMRGAMARSRSAVLRTMRGWQEIEWDNDPERQHLVMQEYRKKFQQFIEDTLKHEREVMTDLRSLLESRQLDEGWPRFERSRRRLLIRGASYVVAQARAQIPDASHDSGVPDTRAGPVDVVAMVRASKLSDAEFSRLADIIETYESGMESLISSWRPFVRGKASTYMGYWGQDDANSSISKHDLDTMLDIYKRMRQLQVRAARAVEDALDGESRERFQRQRLKRETSDRWQSSRHTPEVIAVLKLRSLTHEQRTRVLELVRRADSELLALAIRAVHRIDEQVLLDKKPEQSGDEWTGGSAADVERLRQAGRIIRNMAKDVLQLLTPDQRAAYDSGLENDQDLTQAFSKRRIEADSAWEIDQDLNPWMDVWQAQLDED